MANNIYISDELLAAYLDGTTNEEETQQVLQALKTDATLQETFDIALSLDTEEQETSMDILPMIQLAAESHENLCSVLCEAYILRRRGIEFKEKALLETARENYWLKAEGSPLHTIGQLLANEGLMVTRKYDATLNDLMEALALDNDLIVAVDCDKLYPGRVDEEDASNHAVVVTGIDQEAGTITLYDPQEPSSVSISLTDFLRAWHESHNYMVRVLRFPEEYNPQPINLNSITLSDDLLELREAIAENAHDVWAAARIKEGWTYGKVRDDEKKQHPDLIPYSALPDSEKEYDRLMALDTIKLVKKLGFEITKKV